MSPILDFLADLELDLYDGATGLLIESTVIETGYVQLFGPFPLDTAEVHVFIEQLLAEEARDPEAPRCTYAVRHLFPPSSAVAS